MESDACAKNLIKRTGFLKACPELSVVRVTYIKLVMLVGAVMVLSTTTALCQVSFSQGGSTAEPLSVDSTITYLIPITNEKSSTLSYSVTLTAGPDKDNVSINLEKTQSDIFVDPQQTKIVKFEVNFHDPRINQGEFNRWLTDKNDVKIWDKAWYHAEISQFREQLVPLEDYSGHPQLMKTIFEYSDADVSPKQGTNENLYSYKVTILGSYKDNITLQVRPSQNVPWIDLDSGEYSTPGSYQTLYWNNKSLNFDFNAAYYRFVGKIESQPKVGPVWPIALQFRNNTLSPQNGTPRTEFSYGLELNASKPIDVALNVLDPGTGNFFLAGISSYKNSSTWEKLTWSGIKVTSNEDVAGQSSYNFSFHYPGSAESFNSTKDMLGQDYQGPYVNSWEIEANVTPDNGSIYTPFSYTARIYSNKSAADIGLEIQPPNSTIWQAQGRQTYSMSYNVLKWPDLSFRSSPEVLGVGKYRLVMDNSVLGEFSGPKIDVAVRNESFKKLPNNNFDYTAEVRSIRPKVDMELMFTDDGVTWERTGLFRTYASGNNSSAQAPWEVLTWQDQPWHKTIRVDERRT